MAKKRFGIHYPHFLDPIRQAGNVKDLITGDSSAEAQNSANDNAKDSVLSSVDKQIDLIKEGGDNGKQLIENLNAYLIANNVTELSVLLNANSKVSNIFLQSALEAYNSEIVGADKFSNKLIETTQKVRDELLTGNTNGAKVLIDASNIIYLRGLSSVSNKSNAAKRANLRSSKALSDAINSSSDNLISGAKGFASDETTRITNFSDIERAGEIDSRNILESGINKGFEGLSESILNKRTTSLSSADKKENLLSDFVNQASTDLISGANTSADVGLQAIDAASNISQESSQSALSKFDSIKNSASQTFTPWIKNGVWANQELQDNYENLTKEFTLDDFEKDPGFDFRLGNALNTITNRGAALGITGNTAKDLVEYSQNFASNEFGNAFNRFNSNQNDKINFLSNLSATGLNAANNFQQISSNADTNSAQLIDREGSGQSNFALNRGDVESNRQTTLANILSKAKTQLGEISANAIDSREIANNAFDTSTGEIKFNKPISLSQIASDSNRNLTRINSNESSSIDALKSSLGLSTAEINSNRDLTLGEILSNLENNSGNINIDKINSQRDLFESKTSSLAGIDFNRINSSARINSAASGDVGNIEANNIATKEDLFTQFINANRDINAAKTNASGTINADFYNKNKINSSNIASLNLANINNTSANLINAEGLKGSTLSDFYTNKGNIKANQQANQLGFLNALISGGSTIVAANTKP